MPVGLGSCSLRRMFPLSASSTATFVPSDTHTFRPFPVTNVKHALLGGCGGQRAILAALLLSAPSSISSTPPGMPTHSLPPTAYWLYGAPSSPTVWPTSSVSGSIAVAVRASQFNAQILFPPAVTSEGVNESGTSATAFPVPGSLTAIELAWSRTGLADAEPVARSTAAAAP